MTYEKEDFHADLCAEFKQMVKMMLREGVFIGTLAVALDEAANEFERED